MTNVVIHFNTYGKCIKITLKKIVGEGGGVKSFLTLESQVFIDLIAFLKVNSFLFLSMCLSASKRSFLRKSKILLNTNFWTSPCTEMLSMTTIPCMGQDLGWGFP